MFRILSRHLLLALTLLFTTGFPKLVAATEDLSGSWVAGPMIVQWSVESWGDACGPRPRGGTESGGAVQISKAGGGLIWRGLSRSYSTSQCWERLPGLSRVSHSASKTRWVNVCKKPPNDPRKAQLRTVITARDNRILFDETGQFSFYVKDTKCAASSRRTRTLRRADPSKQGRELSESSTAKADQARPTTSDGDALNLADRGKASAEPGSSEAKRRSELHTTSTAPRKTQCRALGQAHSVDIVSDREFMKAGENLSLRAVVKDKADCAFQNAKVQWSLVEATEGVALLPNGTLTTTDNTPSGALEVRATSGAVTTTLPVRVASAEEYDAIFAAAADAPHVPPIGKKAVVAIAHVEPARANEADPEDSASSKKLLFLLVLVGVVLALAGFGWWLIRTSGSKSREETAQVLTVLDTKTRTACPTCGELYPMGTRFCGTDGTRLD